MVAYSFKEQFVDPIRVGLSSVSLSFDCEPKMQTIRALGKRRHARPGEELQLYCGMRTKNCRLIGRARCVSVEPIQINVNLDRMLITVNRFMIGKGIRAFARSDGFQDEDDMLRFWKKEHGEGLFIGVIIKWEPP